MNNDRLNKEDYLEEDCLLCMNPKKTIPIERIIAKLDEFLDRNDLKGAEQLLLYWVGESQAVEDRRGLLTIYNELMGFYRKGISEEKAFEYANKALDLVKELGLDSTIGGGTTFLNVGTVYKTYFKSDEALSFYQKALTVFKKELDPNEYRFGGLYNNMALAYADLSRFAEAKDAYFKAIEIMKHAEFGELEQAITYLNLANLEEKEKGLEESEEVIERYLHKAHDLLEKESLPRNGYYAFVIDKCAPTFEYYGYFKYAKELQERAKKIYEGA